MRRWTRRRWTRTPCCLGYCVLALIVSLTTLTLCVRQVQLLEETGPFPGHHVQNYSGTLLKHQPKVQNKLASHQQSAVSNKRVSDQHSAADKRPLTSTNQSLPDKVILPEGLKWLHYQKKSLVITHTTPEKEVEKLYLELVGREHVDCRERRRLGNPVDGGWDICTVGIYRPRSTPHRCLVYSFGVNFDWSFDDAISDEFACEVRSFDPSMRIGQHMHSRSVAFYPWGLGPANREVAMGRAGRWHLKTLGTLLVQLGDSERVIDYLKLDIEGWEWRSLETMFEENVLSRVHQLGVEFHTKDAVTGAHTASTADFRRYTHVLDRLEQLGFRKWYTHHNMFGLHKSQRTGEFVTCCVETVYININMLTPGYLSNGLPDLNVTDEAAVKVEPPASASSRVPWDSMRYPEFKALPRTSKWGVELTYGFSQAEAEVVFYSYVAETTVTCPEEILVGEDSDTSWSVCVAGPLALIENCLIYSLSLAMDWAFDDDIADRADCRLWAIKSRVDHTRDRRRKSKKMYELGLEIEGNLTRNLAKSYRNILHHNAHLTSSIDVLRVDLDGHEWEFITHLIMEGILTNVKQLLLDIHTKEADSAHNDLANQLSREAESENHALANERSWSSSTVSDFVLYWNVLNNLERIGFHLWKSTDINIGFYKSPRTGIMRPCCVRLHLINTNYLT